MSTRCHECPERSSRRQWYLSSDALATSTARASRQRVLEQFVDHMARRTALDRQAQRRRIELGQSLPGDAEHRVREFIERAEERVRRHRALHALRRPLDRR